jgi:hypothetical protein
MRDEMVRKQGVLTLDEAWRGVREHFGDMCAVEGGQGNWLSKHVLSAFRKLTPDTVWDPAGGRWRAQKRNDSINAGSRMLNARPARDVLKRRASPPAEGSKADLHSNPAPEAQRSPPPV